MYLCERMFEQNCDGSCSGVCGTGDGFTLTPPPVPSPPSPRTGVKRPAVGGIYL